MRSIYLLLAIAYLPLSAHAAQAARFTQAVQATCRLQGDGSMATSFILSVPRGDGQQPRLLLVTAAHVVEKSKGERASLILRRWDDAAKEFVRHPLELTIRNGDKPLWTKHPTQDVAILDLPKLGDRQVDALPLSALATAEDFQQLEPGDLVRCLGYPHAAQFNPSKPGFPLVRLGCIASYPIVPAAKHPTFLVDFNTFEGDSGGPIVTRLPSEQADQPRLAILGLVHGQHFLDEKYELVYQKGHIRKRLGLSIIVNAQAITETIEQHLGQ